MSQSLKKAIGKAREKLYHLTRPFKDEGFIMDSLPASVYIRGSGNPPKTPGMSETIEVLFSVRFGRKSSPPPRPCKAQVRRLSRYDLMRNDG